MHEWNNMYPHERIIFWRDFRREIDDRNLTCIELLKETAAFWASLPRGSRSLDYYSPSTWPDPWEILTYELFCENTVSLLMFYTLALLDTFHNNIDICLIDDYCGEFIVPIVDKTYVLNVVPTDIIDVRNEKVKIIKYYDKTEIKNIA